MTYSEKKLSWMEVLNESTEKDLKNETIRRNFNEIQSKPMDKINHTQMDSDMNSNVYHSAVSILSTNKSKNTNNKQQQNTLGKYMLKTSSSSNMSSTIKQQPFSPVAYNSFSNNFHNHNHNHIHHRSSTIPCDNGKLSPALNNISESSSTSKLVSPLTTARTGGGPKSPEDKRRCAVCSDVASGYHYGVWSCEGCKAFFKRSIQGTNEYICPATNTCTIDKHRRKSCQACRLRRCYEVGMTKGTTRRDAKYRRKAVSVCKITSTSNAAANNANVNNQEHGLLGSTSNARTTTGTPSGSQSIHNSNVLSSPQSQINKTTSDSTRIPIPTAEFLSILSQASRLNLLSKVDTNRPLDDQYFLQILAKIFDQELVVLINWAKSVPGYTESLTLDQQVTIIEQSWLDTLILDIIERSIERNDDALQFAPDFIISRNSDLSSPVLNSICTDLFHILQVFKDPHTTHEEFIALKATILINSIPATITSTKAFRLLTNQIYQALQHTCDSNPNVYHDNYIRQTTLLLQIPHIKMLSSKLIRLFLHMRSNELLPQADLLLEMLDAQDTIDISFNMDVNNISLRTENCTQNSLINNNISSTSFEIDNSSMYPNQYPNMLTIDIDKDNIPHLSAKRSPSTPPLSFYKQISDQSRTTNEHFF
ncbi:unnamed protein product [Rotaria sordida]|uniref:Estrogen receptor n=1 Tax=Rotaria sordida TaxID=392033 RepID=A0A819B1V6_9BILA|nr:unnamed protein product [Rotaria sordida]CAF3848884.1 unnamed protein product [Rotaria sordida]